MLCSFDYACSRTWFLRFLYSAVKDKVLSCNFLRMEGRKFTKVEIPLEFFNAEKCDGSDSSMSFDNITICALKSWCAVYANLRSVPYLCPYARNSNGRRFGCAHTGHSVQGVPRHDPKKNSCQPPRPRNREENTHQRSWGLLVVCFASVVCPLCRLTRYHRNPVTGRHRSEESGFVSCQNSWSIRRSG